MYFFSDRICICLGYSLLYQSLKLNLNSIIVWYMYFLLILYIASSISLNLLIFFQITISWLQDAA